ncbi:ribosome rescue GTPase HflX [Marinicellulosiphila megalodicopiae]|uniref:ribosome rescue GTPase HflX n=1 Tax=Marinicellulosiphila megalodicopiae TaxID=2724896 RepID=UPI003BB20A87
MFFERVDSGDQAVLVHINFVDESEREDPDEFLELVISAGVTPLITINGSRKSIHPKSFVGSGKIEEIKVAVDSLGANVVLFNHTLSPRQEWMIEQELGCRVIDRTGLILDIFAQRARTHEGKLQVELAQLHHQSTRASGGWTHLDRQKGGVGMRGTGETQLETDRRLIDKRITWVKSKVLKVAAQRDQSRKTRVKSATKTVAICGYTNAGKSTLFNYLTTSSVYAADQLFATLDPTIRRLEIPGLGKVMLADTVGFIRHLPHKLIDAFKSTLQETSEADLLLHVVDCSNPDLRDNIAEVEDVLKEIEAHEIPCILIFNKIDNLPGREPSVEYNDEGKPTRIWLSAKNGLGCELVENALLEALSDDLFEQDITLSPKYGQLRAMLFEQNAVLAENFDDNGECVLSVKLQSRDFKMMLSRANIDPIEFIAQEKEFYEK